MSSAYGEVRLGRALGLDEEAEGERARKAARRDNGTRTLSSLVRERGTTRARAREIAMPCPYSYPAS